MSFRRVPVAAIGLLAMLLVGSASAQPERKIVALGYDRPDPKALAGQLADLAQRCWLPTAPEFAGLKFDRIEPGQEPNAYRVIFAEKQKVKTQPRYLRVLVGQFDHATVILVDQEGIDASETVGRDARAIVKGRATSC